MTADSLQQKRICAITPSTAPSCAENWWHGMGAVLALLRQTHAMILNAEARLEEQERRIALLENLATTDELTGLMNRRGFYQTFTQELDRAARGLSAGGLLVLVDLDNFKTINDVHGHLAGDAALRLVARSLQHDIRTMDAAARLGGDEFVLLLSGADRKETAQRAQMLAWRLNHLSLTWQGEEIPVHASLGLKNYKGGDQPDRIFNEADQTLYAAKRRKKETRKGEGHGKLRGNTAECRT